MQRTVVPLDAMERARWELAAMAGRLRSLEARLVEERRLAEAYRQERDRERKRADRLRGSESYRLGFGLVSLLRDPVGTLPRLTRAVLRRVSRPRAAGARPVPGPGRAPVAAARPPVHLYVVIGMDADGVRDFVLTLRQRLLVSPDHRPVVVTDCPSFAPLRDQGVLLEYLPDRATWDRHRPDRPWEDVLSERLSRLYRDHDTVRTIIVDRSRPPTLAELLR
ncbi:hypothetical protein Ade02nite_07520 [Paractinoplanes deccanensis]|uniref:Uncharacterized protein n=1 Tax=Paractinoplanes deccanensis TaxID=113561 RepID=A0ABQ3XWM3_9ACTN|nr:hypothetical protein [Actinoplanes deccanensis]GID72111.1 hypothetical protein Ade02nite_07520 [Actinoplanes deccanensis]